MAVKDTQEAIIRPLYLEVKRRLKGINYTDIAQRFGWDNNYASRTVGARTMSPSWVGFTQLLILAGMTPNEAAALAGLYEAEDFELTGDEREVIRWLRNPNLSQASRDTALSILKLAVEGYAGVPVASDLSQTMLGSEEEPKKDEEKKVETRKSTRKVK